VCRDQSGLGSGSAGFNWVMYLFVEIAQSDGFFYSAFSGIRYWMSFCKIPMFKWGHMRLDRTSPEHSH